MGEITDPELLKVLNGTGEAPRPQRSGPVYGAPPKPEKPNLPSGYEPDGQGGLRPIPGGPADPAAEPPEAPKAPEGYMWVGEPGSEVVPIPGGPKDKTPKTDDPDAVRSLTNVLDKLDTIALDSADNNGWFETGTTGSLMRKYGPGGTPAFDLAGDIKTIDANTAFAALQKMRDNSPTGGALGNITEKELELLKSTVSNIDPDLSQPTFFKNLADAKRYYLDTLRRISPETADAYKLKRGIRFKDDGTPILVSVDGEDEREAEDPMGILGAGGGDPSGSGGGGGGPGSGPAPSGPDRSGYTPDMLSLLGTGLARGTGDIVEGAGDFAGIALNPIGNLWYKMLGYNQPYDAGTVLREAVGLPDNPDPLSSMINKGGSAALTGSLAAKGIGALAAPGAMKNALSVLSAQPGRDIAIGGAASGAGELAREGGYGAPVQALATLAGGLGSSAAANRVVSSMVPKLPTALAQAAERQGVNLLPADTGGPVSGLVTSAARASPISISPIVSAAKKAQDQMSMAVGRAAQSQGSVPTTDTAGEWLQQAAKRYSAKTKDIGDTLYRRAFKAAGDVSVPAPGAVAKIDGMLKGLRANPETNAGAIQDLIKLRRDLVRGQTAEQMHQLRSEIGQGVFDGNLRSGTDKGRMKAIRGALTEDMLGFFDKNFMPGIAKGIRRADEYHAERVKQIDEVLQPIIGKDGFKGGEQVVQAVEGMARGTQGGNKRLSRLMSNMTGPERGEIRSTLIDRLGRATPGQQNAEGDVFSPATFLTNWNKMTPQAKATLFGDDGLRKNLDDVAKLAEGTKRSQAMANYSNTAGAIGANMALQTTWALSHLPTYLAGLGAQLITGRLMASPKFAKWLARAPDATTPVAQRKMLDQLGIIASREPALQQDALALQSHLKDSLTRSPGSAAAEDEEGN